MGFVNPVESTDLAKIAKFWWYKWSIARLLSTLRDEVRSSSPEETPEHRSKRRRSWQTVEACCACHYQIAKASCFGRARSFPRWCDRVVGWAPVEQRKALCCRFECLSFGLGVPGRWASKMSDAGQPPSKRPRLSSSPNLASESQGMFVVLSTCRKPLLLAVVRWMTCSAILLLRVSWRNECVLCACGLFFFVCVRVCECPFRFAANIERFLLSLCMSFPSLCSSRFRLHQYSGKDRVAVSDGAYWRCTGHRDNDRPCRWRPSVLRWRCWPVNAADSSPAAIGGEFRLERSGGSTQCFAAFCRPRRCRCRFVRWKRGGFGTLGSCSCVYGTSRRSRPDQYAWHPNASHRSDERLSFTCVRRRANFAAGTAW